MLFLNIKKVVRRTNWKKNCDGRFNKQLLSFSSNWQLAVTTGL